MKIVKKDTYTLVSSEGKTFKKFLESFTNSQNDLIKNHLVLELSSFDTINSKDFSLFLELSNQMKKNGMSFVVVCSILNTDDFPEAFNIVPTLTEAEDILEMEAIERELGF